MTELDLDRRIDDWLRESAPTHAPERTLMGGLTRVADLGQERHLTQHIFGDRLGRSAQLRWGLALTLLALAGVTGAIVAAGTLRAPVPTGEASNGWVAYARDGDIHVVRDGMPSQRVVGRDGDGVEQTCPVFSPDGSSLAHLEVVDFRPDGGPSNVVLTGRAAADRPDGSAIRIPTTPSPTVCPGWAPDGRHLALLQSGPLIELLIVDLDGTMVSRFRRDETVSAESSTHVFRDGRFAWSPDGSTVAIVLGYGPGASEVWLVPAAGGEPRQLLVGPTDDEVFESIAWTPDGSGVTVFGHTETETPDGETPPPTTYFIRLVPTNGRAAPTELDRWIHLPDTDLASGPAWSPDGTRFAYVRNGRIVVAATDGSDSRELPPVEIAAAPGDEPPSADNGAEWWPGALSWSPDGRRILSLGTGFPYLDRGVPSAVVSIDPDGIGAPIMLTAWRLANYSDREPRWQPVVTSVPAWDADAAGVSDPSPLEGLAGPSPTPTQPPRPEPAATQP